MSASPVLPDSRRPEEYADPGDSPTRERGPSGRLEAFLFRGPAGNLEGLWKGSEGPRAGSAVFAHPHPLHGGTLHNKVVFRAAKALTRAGYGVLRFNFRGVGLSHGTYDGGRGEVEDFRSALDEAARRGGAPVVAGGFSFGSAAGLRAIAGDARVRAFIGVGVPLGSLTADPPPVPTVPALFVTGSEDVHGPPALLREWAGATGRIVIVPGADHFLEGKLEVLESTIGNFLAEISGSSAA